MLLLQVGPPRKSSAPGVREPSRRPGSSLCSGAQAWIQHSAGTCPNSWRDGFARDCPLRHPVAWVLALRVCSGLTAVFLVVCGALSAVTGKAPGKREAAEARSRAVSRRSSRKPGFVVRGGRSRDTRPRTADLGSGDRGHGPMLSPDPCKSLAPPRVASREIPVDPGKSRDHFFDRGQRA